MSRVVQVTQVASDEVAFDRCLIVQQGRDVKHWWTELTRFR